MERLTNHNRWSDDIDLKNEYGYKYIYDRLAEYEKTGLSPDEIKVMQNDLINTNMNLEIMQHKFDNAIELLDKIKTNIHQNCRNCEFDDMLKCIYDDECHNRNHFKWQFQDELEELK